MSRLFITPLEAFASTITPEDVTLGPWCTIGDKNSFAQELALAPTTQSPDVCADDYARTNATINDLIDRLLPGLTRFANTLHGTDHSSDFWKPIYVPWLHEWLLFCTNIYRRLQSTEQLGHLQTKIAAPFEYHVEASKEFSMLRDSPQLALYITSDLIRHSEDFPWISYKEISYFNNQIIQDHLTVPETFPRGRNPRHSSWADRLNARYRDRSRLFLKGITGMMPKQELFLNVMTDPLGLVRPKSYTYEEFPTNWETFSATAIDITPLNGFERTIARCIKTHLPMRVLRYEKYAFKRPILHVGYRHHRLGNEYFTSHLKEQGGVWYGDQHGGGYGMFQVPDLKHEYEPVHKYITWGWKQPEYERDIFIPLPSPYLSCRRAESSTNRETLVFITEPVTTLHPFRQHAFGMSVDNVEGLNMRVDFLANLESTPLSKTIYRTKLFPLAHTFDDNRGIKKAFPQIPICPTSEKSFLDVMDETRLLINESLNSSTLIQALSMDVPTIAYYDPKQATLTSEFSQMAEILIDAGILHTSPQSAANHANAVWDDVDSWWTSEQCIQAKEAYCRGWALNSPKWYWTWARFLRNTVSKLNRNQ